MFTVFWELKFNPFAKGSGAGAFESEDFRQASARLGQLAATRGIGLFTGVSGSGKTFALKRFVDSLNPSLFKAVYLPLSTLTVLEFYRALAFGFGVSPRFKKIDMFHELQERIWNLYKDKRVTPLIIIDEAQYLDTKILNDLKILMNFEMDSRNFAALALVGQPILSNTLSLQTHEALAQRVIINYSFNGLSKTELAEYISSRLLSAGAANSMFSENALEAIWARCGASPRVVDSLAEKSLMIGCQKNARQINADIVTLAQNENTLL